MRPQLAVKKRKTPPLLSPKRLSSIQTFSRSATSHLQGLHQPPPGEINRPVAPACRAGSSKMSREIPVLLRRVVRVVFCWLGLIE